MSIPREVQEKAWKSPNIGKHGKWKKTIEKEKRRELFDSMVSQEFGKIINDAKAEYKLDQFIGKAPDKLEVSGELNTNNSFTAEEIAILKANVKKKQLRKE